MPLYVSIRPGIYFLLCILGLLGFSLKAQPKSLADSVLFQEITLEQISISEGLSQGMINAMVEDENGYLWIATKEGLNRYDGTGFKVFRHDPSNPFSLSDNFTYSLLVDRWNRLWVGTQSHGVDMFDPLTERFHHYTSETVGLSSDMIGGLVEDNDGNIIAETLNEEGFNVIMVSKDSMPDGSLYPVKKIMDVYPCMKRFSGESDWTKDLYFTADGSLWYFDSDSLFLFKNPTSNESSQCKSFEMVTRDLRDWNGLHCILNPERTELYVADSKQTLWRFNSTARDFVVHTTLPKHRYFGHKQFIDRNNRFWTWQKDGTVLRLNLNTKTFDILKPDWNRLEEGAFNHTGILLEDRYGNCWLGTGGNGILKISRRVDLFKSLPPSVLKADGSTYIYRSVLQGNKALMEPRLAAKWQLLQLDQVLKHDHLEIDMSSQSLVHDGDGNFWFQAFNSESEGQHIVKADETTGAYEIVSSIEKEGTKWFGFPMFFDQQGDLWLGEKFSAEGILLYQLNPKTKELKSYAFPLQLNKMQYRFISDWHEASDGKLWFATTVGLFSFSPKTKEWQSFQNIEGDESSLSFNLTLSICADPHNPDRYLWVGTESGGLNKFDTKTASFERYDTDDGLPNNVVYAILSDDRKNLWLSTNRGLCLFNPETKNTRNFTQSDGLAGNEFNRYQFSKASDGSLYFGGTSGIVYFHPEDAYEGGKASPVVINRLELLSEPVVFQSNLNSSNQSILRSPIEQCKELVLDYENLMITFGFTALDFTTPERNRFKYRLEGFNLDWIEAGHRDVATYTNLSPGTYTLMVMGCNSFNVWSDEPTTLQLTILPPWWGTLWFRLLIILVISGGLYSIYQYRLRQLLKIEKMRNSIAQDLHDEIGSTLSSISLYSTVMLRSSDHFPKNVSDILDKIVNSTTEIMTSMNDIVWTIKADNDSFEQVVNRMRAFAVTMTEAKQIELHFEADPKVERLEMGMDKRKNIYLIFKEAVNNAMKYAECSELSVSIQKEPRALTLEIRDNGIGFELDSRQRTVMNGNGLRGMKDRAKEIGATLEIESALGDGCRIILVVRH